MLPVSLTRLVAATRATVEKPSPTNNLEDLGIKLRNGYALKKENSLDSSIEEFDGYDSDTCYNEGPSTRRVPKSPLRMSEFDEMSFIATVTEVLELSVPSVAAERILKTILRYTNGTEILFIRKQFNRLVLDGAMSQEKTFSLLQATKLSKISSFSHDIFLQAKCSEKTVLVAGRKRVQALGADCYSNQTRVPESVLCIPIFSAKELSGAIYITHQENPEAFSDTNSSVIVLAISNLISLINQSSLQSKLREYYTAISRGDIEALMAHEQTDTKLRDSLMFYQCEDWDNTFAVLTDDRMLIFATPFDSNPLSSIDIAGMADVHILSSRNSKQRTIPLEAIPTFPKKAKATLGVKMKSGDYYWLAMGSLRTSKSWFDALKDAIGASVTFAEGDIPENIRINPKGVIIGDIIGQGGAATVYSGEWQNQKIAIKKLYDTINQSEITDFFREMKMLHSLRHPNVITLMGGFICPEGRPSIVFEFAERGCLNTILESEESITMITKLSLIQQIGRALQYLHSFDPPIIHRDLKPANVLVRVNF